MLLSSHLLDEVQEICDRVGVINDGRLLRESTVAALRGGVSLSVRGPPVDRALAVAMRIAGDDGVRRARGPAGPRPPCRTPRRTLTRTWSPPGSTYTRSSVVERTLEEAFFEMTATHDELEKVS